MADNVAITAGTGTTILADELVHATYGTGKAQAVKLLLGAAGTGVDAIGGTGTDSTAVMRVSLATNVALPAGTNAIGKLAANSGVDIGDVDVTSLPALPAGTNAIGLVKITNDAGTVIDPIAQVAHDAADSGAPIKVGFKAVGAQSDATLVTDDDRSNMVGGRDGSLYVRKVAFEDIVSGKASNTDGTVTTVLAASGDAAIKTYLTQATLVNMHASTVAYVELYSGAVSMYYVPVPPGGCVLTFDPPLPPNAANETWRFDPSAAVTTLYCSMVGFKSKV